jgi:hypothetical protein
MVECNESSCSRSKSLRLQDDSLHSTTDSTTHVLSTLEKEEDLLRLQDDSLHSTTDSTTHVLSVVNLPPFLRLTTHEL